MPGQCDGDFAETQNWYVFSAGSSYVSLKNDNSGRNLGIDGASTTSGAAAIQANGSSDLNQDWELITKTSYPAGWYALKNRKSGLCRGISGAGTANGAQAAQFACDDSANQLWKPDDR
ncbi:RICIN domain-containing protein [Streptomyces sp. NBC_00582]|uniref:RICIN domain-containing protein n=1 Tax=Streptomyces sp. NBC_00582 TaxID=2975783 RepID=UPI002E7FF5BC|nr:RICIN domain-containing protein [Streptomyces sp. NBC_00582]WUB67783.1 RICIN domain-containing protein [Streptomyces sp. NBC_00582]WUB68268.1 RICIN domain-containing protein [Streptomyces sp. NBC_00582]